MILGPEHRADIRRRLGTGYSRGDIDWSAVELVDRAMNLWDQGLLNEADTLEYLKMILNNKNSATHAAARVVKADYGWDMS